MPPGAGTAASRAGVRDRWLRVGRTRKQEVLRGEVIGPQDAPDALPAALLGEVARVRSSAGSSPSPRSAACTIATSAARPDADECRCARAPEWSWATVARQESRSAQRGSETPSTATVVPSLFSTSTSASRRRAQSTRPYGADRVIDQGQMRDGHPLRHLPRVRCSRWRHPALSPSSRTTSVSSDAGPPLEKNTWRRKPRHTRHALTRSAASQRHQDRSRARPQRLARGSRTQ